MSADRETDHFRFWPPDAPRSLRYPKTSIYYNFEVSARRYPDKTCLNFYGREIDYQTCEAAMTSLAGYLQHDCGVARGARVIVDLQNSPQFVLAFYGVLRADAMVVPVNPMSRTAELEHYVADSGAQVAIVAQDTLPWFTPLLGTTGLRHLIVVSYSDYLPEQTDFEIPTEIAAPRRALPEAPAGCSVIDWHAALALARTAQPHRAGPDDFAALPYTSGSTGQPKGCLHTHGTLMATCMMVSHWKGITTEQIVLATAPFFHVTGMVGSMNAPLYSGSTIVVLPRWDAVNAAKLIERFGCTSWTNVPPMVVDLLTNPAATRFNLRSLKYIGGGGAAMPQAIATRLKEEYGLDYLEGYGMTETAAPTHSNPYHRPKKQCLGVPIFDTEAHVIDPDSGRVLGPNEQGEIVMRGPQILKTYWNQPEAFAQSLIQIDGKTFFRSGDLGYRDDDGYYFISDRLKRMINASGFKVWPAEVENFFYQHPAIRECCVIASPDAKRGETVKLIAILKPGHGTVGAEQLIAWAREKMAAYKVPRVVELRTEPLPRTGTGKIFWRQLQDLEYGRSA